jgi:hypothetical protein
MSSWTPTNYKTKNWSNYNRALKQRGSLSIWFDAEMEWDAKPSGSACSEPPLIYATRSFVWLLLFPTQKLEKLSAMALS